MRRNRPSKTKMIEILATIKSALTITKEIRDIADNVATAELKLKIAG